MMGWAGEKAFDFTLPNRQIVCIAIVQMWGAYSTGMTKNLVLHCVHRLSRMGLSRGDIATSPVPPQARVYTTVHPIPEPGIGLKQGHWGSWLLYIRRQFTLSWQPKTIPKQNNQSYFSPFYTNNTQSVLSRSHSKRMTVSYNLSTHTPTHQHACGEVFLTLHI